MQSVISSNSHQKTMRHVFFSFDWYDIWRVNQVRHSWVAKGNYAAAGFVDSAEIETLKRNTDQAIKNWIDRQMYVWLALIPTLSFWMLDGFYLNQEKLFRRLYDAVRETDEEEIDFSMDIVPFKQSGDWFKAVFSKTLLFFYPTILLVIGIVLLWQLIGQDVG